MNRGGVDNGGPRLRERGWYRAIFHPGAVFRESEVYRSAVYPVKVPREVLKTRSTLRLGFIAVVLYLILFISGMYLMFFYRPVAPDAYYNMHELSTTVAFGQFVRNIHRWSAHLMVLVVCLHMLRVFYSGAYKAPRQFNWIVGVGLLVFTLLMSFTGYLLPWDQLSYWAITVGTNIAGYVPIFGNQARNVLLGGPSVGNETLLRFYVLHIYFLPALIFVVLGVHIWRVRKDGFAVAGRKEQPPEPEAAAASPEETIDAQS